MARASAVPVRLLSAGREGAPADISLAAHLYLPETATTSPGALAPGLVVGHGAGSRASRHERFCLAAREQGFVVLALDFRGHGDSTGVADGPLEEDILSAVDYLRSHPAVDPAAVCYRGSSMGGFYGLKAALRAEFAALVLLCPAGEAVMLDAIDSAATEDLPPGTETQTDRPAPTPLARWDRVRLRRYFELQDSLRLAARVCHPVLIIHARGDQTVPLDHSCMLARHLAGDAMLMVLQGGSHTTAQHDPRVHDYSLRWLTRNLERTLS